MAIYGVSFSEGELYEDGRDEDGEVIVRRGSPHWYVYDLEKQGLRSYVVETFDTEAAAQRAFDRLTGKRAAQTECGFTWDKLPQSCIVCNGGGHYHYGDGGCDTEPCVRHGGPY